MPSFLERYRSGEFEQVWDELRHLGHRVRTPPLFADAQGVARETMRRARANIERLIPRLEDLGFRFAYEPDSAKRVPAWWGDSEPVYEPPRTHADRFLNVAELTVGPLPLSLRAWWEVVGSVNFIGMHADWPDIDVTDPIVVGPVEMLEGIAEKHREWLKEVEEENLSDCPFGVDIAPDNYHKANCSGGSPYSVEFPCVNADGLFDGGPMTFVQYLRNAFRWGGFPGFAGVEPARRPSAHLSYLTSDLLPL